MRSQCRACGRVFSGMTLFSEHRSGTMNQSGPDYGRRCLSDHEIASRGWRLISGVWKGEEMPGGWHAHRRGGANSAHNE